MKNGWRHSKQAALAAVVPINCSWVFLRTLVFDRESWEQTVTFHHRAELFFVRVSLRPFKTLHDKAHYVQTKWKRCRKQKNSQVQTVCQMRNKAATCTADSYGNTAAAYIEMCDGLEHRSQQNVQCPWDVMLNPRNPSSNCLVETQGVFPHTALVLRSSTRAWLWFFI